MPSDASSVQFINPDTLPRANGYSHVAVVTGGRTIHIAGQIALDGAGTLVGEGDMHAQARQVFENLKAALEAAGADFRHVVRLNFYLLDASRIGEVREVRDRYVNLAAPPVSTAIEIRRFVRDGLLIEIDAVAVVDG